MVGRSPRADSDRPRGTRPIQEAFDPAVSWAAELQAPTRAVRQDSRESLAVQITAPVQLTAQVVALGLEARDGSVRWGPATWAGPVDHRRTAIGTLGHGKLAVAPGLYRVLVRVQTLDQAPVLDAGAVAIT